MCVPEVHICYAINIRDIKYMDNVSGRHGLLCNNSLFGISTWTSKELSSHFNKKMSIKLEYDQYFFYFLVFPIDLFATITVREGKCVQ